MRKHGGTPSWRHKHVTLAAISPPGVAQGRFAGGHQSGLAGCKPPPLFMRGASSCLSQGRRQGERRGTSPGPSAPTYLPTYLPTLIFGSEASADHSMKTRDAGMTCRAGHTVAPHQRECTWNVNGMCSWWICPFYCLMLDHCQASHFDLRNYRFF